MYSYFELIIAFSLLKLSTCYGSLFFPFALKYWTNAIISLATIRFSYFVFIFFFSLSLWSGYPHAPNWLSRWLPTIRMVYNRASAQEILISLWNRHFCVCHVNTVLFMSFPMMYLLMNNCYHFPPAGTTFSVHPDDRQILTYVMLMILLEATQARCS